MTVAIIGTVGSTGIIAAATALKDIKPFTQALVQPVAIPLWLLVGASAMSLLLIAGLWRRTRSTRRRKAKPFVPDEIASSIVAVMRMTDKEIDEDVLIEHLVKVAPAHVGRRDIQLTMNALREAGWIVIEHGAYGFGFALSAEAIAFCRANDIQPTKRPSAPDGFSYVD